ncbi:CASP-like protein 5A1 [Iris pallida]|uniref:CASP-like protein 5A1 n=1 Tax=Iris pallida TaxID=29817 RepID=A0AAX6DLA2_IRIPA|nr:CASP-like protein 5A1 [Iris pallida]
MFSEPTGSAPGGGAAADGGGGESAGAEDEGHPRGCRGRPGGSSLGFSSFAFAVSSLCIMVTTNDFISVTRLLLSGSGNQFTMLVEPFTSHRGCICNFSYALLAKSSYHMFLHTWRRDHIHSHICRSLFIRWHHRSYW